VIDKQNLKFYSLKDHRGLIIRSIEQASAVRALNSGFPDMASSEWQEKPDLHVMIIGAGRSLFSAQIPAGLANTRRCHRFTDCARA
jgi:hypothetical protein